MIAVPEGARCPGCARDLTLPHAIEQGPDHHHLLRCRGCCRWLGKVRDAGTVTWEPGMAEALGLDGGTAVLTENRSDDREPGYCVICGDFHLLTPVPGRPGAGVCGAPSCWERLEPYEPGPRHVCNTGDRLKPGHLDYRRCSCGQWFHSGGGYWYRVQRPPVRWLREHGMDAGEFWSYGDEAEDRPSFGEAFGAGASGWRYLLRWLLRRLS